MVKDILKDIILKDDVPWYDICDIMMKDILKDIILKDDVAWYDMMWYHDEREPDKELPFR